MVRKKLLLVVVLAVAATMFVGSQSASAAPPTCSNFQLWSGTCHVAGAVNGDAVDVSGTATTPGSSNSGGPKRGGTRGTTGRPKPAAPAPGNPLDVTRGVFTVTNPLTIGDLASFKPIPGTDHMEPNGWMIVGLDTNFYAAAGNEIVDGTLLGQPASVRFTPVAWHWAYGDGTSATRATAGATWAAQGIQQFDPTVTSHVYRKAGTYYIDLGIEFGAEYEYATGAWIPVDGTITIPANRLKATAGSAKTVLVNRDCTQNPSGPGC
jgi:hypothetical protein